MNAWNLAVIIVGQSSPTQLHFCLRSVERAARKPRSLGWTVDIVVVGMAATSYSTKSVVDHHQDVLFTDSENLTPQSLPSALRSTDASLLFFLDSALLCSENWILRTAEELSAIQTPSVVHVEQAIGTFSQARIQKFPSSTDSQFSLGSMLISCPWWGAFAVHRDVVKRVGTPGLDWPDWFERVIALGIPIVTAAKTVAYVKDWKRTTNLDALPQRSILFEPETCARLIAQHHVYQPVVETTVMPRRSLLQRTKEAFKSLVRFLIPRRLRHAFFAATWDYPGNAPRSQPPVVLPEIPSAIHEDWRNTHLIDPEFFPDPWAWDCAAKARASELGVEKWNELCLEFTQKLPRECTHLLLVPWLKTGGSDRTAINYATALAAQPGAKVVVAATENTDSPWSHRLPDEVQFVELGALLAFTAEADSLSLLARFVAQSQPAVIHNINSRLGYELLAKHGAILRRRSQLFCHVFCDDFTADGRSVGYNRHQLPRCIDHLTAVLSDNQTELDHLHQMFLFDRRKLITHYQPIDIPQHTSPRARRGAVLHVLWAGRLDRQKRPDLLQDIAKACEAMPFRFHVHGTPLFREQLPIPEGANIEYHGPFDGFSSLPIENYDVYLYTSQWDGLPNILSEAIVSGLPIVASNVGGVKELIHDHETGLLVEPFDSVAKFTSALGLLHENPDLGMELASNALRLVARQHSWDAFRQSLANTPGYFDRAKSLQAA
jgi:glycosyltransferase involved in cell wall biosynthesis